MVDLGYPIKLKSLTTTNIRGELIFVRKLLERFI